jgi:hypothetical protein
LRLTMHVSDNRLIWRTYQELLPLNSKTTNKKRPKDIFGQTWHKIITKKHIKRYSISSFSAEK